MAARLQMHQVEFVLVNVYAPTSRAEREALFAHLQKILSHVQEPIVIGGDWNCTLHPSLDRSYETTRNNHESPALRDMLSHIELVDALEDDIEQAIEERDHHRFQTSTHQAMAHCGLHTTLEQVARAQLLTFVCNRCQPDSTR